MKKLTQILTCGLAFSSAAGAQQIFDGYEKYYPTISDSIFKQKSTKIYTGLKGGVFRWKKYRIQLRKTILFPGEFSTDEDLGRDPIIYETSSWACIEGQASSASGTAVRHFAVYVIDARSVQRIKLYKLPSLFASCLDVRMDKANRFVFDSATYLYDKDGNSPTGLALKEYVVKNNRFYATNNIKYIKFIETDNVWKFIVSPTQ